MPSRRSTISLRARPRAGDAKRGRGQRNRAARERAARARSRATSAGVDTAFASATKYASGALARRHRCDEREMCGGEIADAEHAAPIAGSPRAAAAMPRRSARVECREVALRARPVHERQAQDDRRRMPVVRATSPARVPRPDLLARVGVARIRRIAFAKRAARQRRFAVHLDRAREDEMRRHRRAAAARARRAVTSTLTRRAALRARIAAARCARPAR